MTKCVGHRGAAGLAPENTVAAFRAGIAAGADLLECDVHRTSDGHLVVMHDADVARTTDGTGHIGALPLAAVQRLNAAARFPGRAWPAQSVPTLEEVLAVADTVCGIQIEIKVPPTGPYPEVERLVLEAVGRAAVHTVQVISFDPDTLGRVRALDSAVELGFIADESSLHAPLLDDPAALAAFAHRHGATFLTLGRRYLRPAHLMAAHERGIGLAVWTVNDPTEMRKFAGMELMAITSDRPDLLRVVLDGGDERRGASPGETLQPGTAGNG